MSASSRLETGSRCISASIAEAARRAERGSSLAPGFLAVARFQLLRHLRLGQELGAGKPELRHLAARAAHAADRFAMAGGAARERNAAAVAAGPPGQARRLARIGGALGP